MLTLMTILHTLLIFVNLYLIGQCMSFLKVAFTDFTGFLIWMLGVYLRIYGTIDRITSS
jgi:hypothetical protein